MAIETNSIPSNRQYRHLLTLSYNQVVPFIFEYLKKYTLPVVTALFLLLLSLIPVIFIRIALAGYFPWYRIFFHTVAGLIFIPLLLVIPHEILHIVPYYISGARDIRIGANWKEAYFYVTAHNHAVSAHWFITIALFPVIIITAILYLLLTMSAPLWQWSLACAASSHLTMCAGDIALLSFYYINRNKRIITWDDAEKREAYFYEKLSG